MTAIAKCTFSNMQVFELNFTVILCGCNKNKFIYRAVHKNMATLTHMDDSCRKSVFIISVMNYQVELNFCTLCGMHRNL